MNKVYFLHFRFCSFSQRATSPLKPGKVGTLSVLAEQRAKVGLKRIPRFSHILACTIFLVYQILSFFLHYSKVCGPALCMQRGGLGKIYMSVFGLTTQTPPFPLEPLAATQHFTIFILWEHLAIHHLTTSPFPRQPMEAPDKSLVLPHSL